MNRPGFDTGPAQLARHSRIPAFVTLQRRIAPHRTAIMAATNNGSSNGRIESMNAKIW